MLKCDSLNEVLKKGLHNEVSYKKFKIDMSVYIFRFLRNLNSGNKLYFPIIIFSREIDEDYQLKDGNIIFINENILEDIYCYFDKDALLKLYYILSKVNERISINNGVVNIRTISTIKDDLLSEFQEKENEKNGINDISYYEKNHETISSEVNAKLESLAWFSNYYKENNLKILRAKEALGLLEKCDKLYKKHKNKNRRISKGIYESEKANLDDLFDFAIINNPDWLKRYPHLQTEYYTEDNVVKRRDFSQFELEDIDNLNEDNDFKEYVKSLVIRDKYKLIKNEDIGKVKKKQKKK